MDCKQATKTHSANPKTLTTSLTNSSIFAAAPSLPQGGTVVPAKANIAGILASSSHQLRNDSTTQIDLTKKVKSPSSANSPSAAKSSLADKSASAEKTPSATKIPSVATFSPTGSTTPAAKSPVKHAVEHTEAETKN